MKLLDHELNIRQITDVQKGTIPISNTACTSRRSDAFVYIISGSATYTFGDRIVTAEKGSVLFLSYRSSYKISVTVPDYTFIFVDFFFEESRDTVLENDVFRSERIALLENDFLKLHRLWSVGNFSDKILCKSLLYRIYGNVAGVVSDTYIPQNRREQIQDSIRTLLENYHDPSFSLERLCRDSHISSVHFRRIFHQIYHTSPVRFLVMLRINKAKELLFTTALPISEIAELCGFRSAYYFSKKFREHTDMTPSEYRQYSIRQH